MKVIESSVAVDFWTGIDNCSYLGYTERWLDENFCLFDLPANIVQHVGELIYDHKVNH